MGVGVSTNTNNNSLNMMNSIQNSCEMGVSNTNEIGNIDMGGFGNDIDIEQKIVSFAKCTFKSDSQFDEQSAQNVAAETKADMLGIAVNTNTNNLSKTISNMTSTKCEGLTLNKNKIGNIKSSGAFNKLKINQNINSKSECGAVSVFKALSKTDQAVESKVAAGIDIVAIIAVVVVVVLGIVIAVVVMLTNKNFGKNAAAVGKAAKDIKRGGGMNGGAGNIIQKIIYDFSQ